MHTAVDEDSSYYQPQDTQLTSETPFWVDRKRRFANVSTGKLRTLRFSSRRLALCSTSRTRGPRKCWSPPQLNVGWRCRPSGVRALALFAGHGTATSRSEVEVAATAVTLSANPVICVFVALPTPEEDRSHQEVWVRNALDCIGRAGRK